MITLDFETRSLRDLRKCGTSAYARDPSTTLLCLAYKLGDEPVKLWTPKDPKPEDLLERVRSGDLVEAHNVFFERNIWLHICCKRLGWPDVPFQNWRCSMAQCSRVALPRALGDIGPALDLKIQKDAEGNRVMLRLCKPTNMTKLDKEQPKWDNSSDKFEILYRYCEQDVESEYAISQTVPAMTPSELKVWQLDQRINLRGLPVDIPLVENAIRLLDAKKDYYDKQIQELTNGEVTSVRQATKLLEFCKGAGVELPNLTKETVSEYLASSGVGVEFPNLTKDMVSEYLANPTNPVVTEALEIRQAASKSSTAKLNKIREMVDEDGRVRGNLVYHGAATGRWAGSGIQIQNFPRGSLQSYEIESAIEFLNGKHDRALELFYGSPFETISGLLRATIKAEPGKRILGCDFAQIEGRVLAWIAGQEDLVEAFRHDRDVYKDMASKIYTTPVEEVTKVQRHVGKTAVLGLGYGMGARAFKNACKVMAGVEIKLKEAAEVVRVYRTTNDRIKAFWGDVNAAAIKAIELDGEPVQLGRLTFKIVGDFLTIRLPSGRSLHYYKPELVKVRAPWSEGQTGTIYAPVEDQEKLEELAITLGEQFKGGWKECKIPKGVKLEYKAKLEPMEPEYIQQIQYKSMNSITRKWSSTRTYGGKLTENVVQAVARDFLVEAMLRVEDAGYPIIATVHDEILAERELGEGSIEEFERIMALVPEWGKGCPLGVEGYEAERFKK